MQNGEKPAPPSVWDYTLGAYQVIKKWLSYREQPLLGRPLTLDEVREVQSIARRVAAILLMEPALDESLRRHPRRHLAVEPTPRPGARMLRRTLVPLALLATLPACGAAPGTAANPSVDRSPPVVETGSRTVVVDASGPIPPDPALIFPTMRRMARIEARPDSVRLAVGGRYDLARLRVAYLDSAGVEIRGVTPRYTVTGSAARVDREGWLEAVRPGTATLLIRPRSRGGAPRPGDPVGRVRIRVVEPGTDGDPR